MVLLRVAHAPAGATTLLISLGLITQPFHFLVIEIAVALLCLQAILINRLAGLNYPMWAGRIDSAMEEVTVAPGARPTLSGAEGEFSSQEMRGPAATRKLLQANARREERALACSQTAARRLDWV